MRLDKEEKAREESNKKVIEGLRKQFEEAQKLAEMEKSWPMRPPSFGAKQQAKITEAQAKELGKRIEAEARFRDESMRTKNSAPSMHLPATRS